jgi:hypothetical protein
MLIDPPTTAGITESGQSLTALLFVKACRGERGID